MCVTGRTSAGPVRVAGRVGGARVVLSAKTGEASGEEARRIGPPVRDSLRMKRGAKEKGLQGSPKNGGCWAIGMSTSTAMQRVVSKPGC